MGFTRAQLESFRDAEVPPLVGDGVKLLFVGINPSLWTAATQTHFAFPGNRFYPALHRAGIIDRLPDFANGLTDADRRMIVSAGIGIANIVRRATARADELTRDELRSGAIELAAFVDHWRPRVVAIAGITAYRQGFDQPRALAGRQPEMLGGGPLGDAEVWVVPNPSGLNAHDTVDTLAAAYAAPARAAGILPQQV